jgi:hypothetical protein
MLFPCIRKIDSFWLSLFISLPLNGNVDKAILERSAIARAKKG